MIAGVCAGLAEYFDIDPSLVRLIIFLSVFLGGVGLALYLVAWLIVPENKEQTASSTYEKNQRLKDDVVGELRRFGTTVAEKLEDSMEDIEDRPERRSMVFLGFSLILIGAAFLLRSFIPWIELQELWPVLLIVLGVVLLVGAARREKVS
jgi:phage shock protein PspC (stress-responsive transcriptional regulator)